ncbi:hypothetical protein AAGG49_22975, partial [Stenotrophomonas maltophilia]|uniref:hypothetical protein n=1 Tax=Stenotrophomonas maltophilia TaxID=40324 RepID=UPI00313EBAE9
KFYINYCKPRKRKNQRAHIIAQEFYDQKHHAHKNKLQTPTHVLPEKTEKPKLNITTMFMYETTDVVNL